MTISAILDLEKAIEIFKHEIQTLLELEDLSDWDGKRLQEREQGIPQTGLELARQCIALLLNALSESPVSNSKFKILTEKPDILEAESMSPLRLPRWSHCH